MNEIANTSIYAVVFNKDSGSFSENPRQNRIFLGVAQNWCNDKLMAQGHLFLNEVYDALGIRRIEEGQRCGWLLNGEGDGRVVFEIFAVPDSDDLIVDFNVDGHILDKAF